MAESDADDKDTHPSADEANMRGKHSKRHRNGNDTRSGTAEEVATASAPTPKAPLSLDADNEDDNNYHKNQAKAGQAGPKNGNSDKDRRQDREEGGNGTGWGITDHTNKLLLTASLNNTKAQITNTRRLREVEAGMQYVAPMPADFNPGVASIEANRRYGVKVRNTPQEKVGPSYVFRAESFFKHLVKEEQLKGSNTVQVLDDFVAKAREEGPISWGQYLRFFQVKFTHEEKGMNIIWSPNWGTECDEGARLHRYLLRALSKLGSEVYLGPAPANNAERALQASVKELETELKKMKV